MEFKKDLCFGSGGHVNVWNKGFFEDCANLSGNKFNEDDYIVIDGYRVKKSNYTRKEDVERIDSYISRNKLK